MIIKYQLMKQFTLLLDILLKCERPFHGSLCDKYKSIKVRLITFLLDFERLNSGHIQYKDYDNNYEKRI